MNSDDSFSPDSQGIGSNPVPDPSHSPGWQGRHDGGGRNGGLDESGNVDRIRNILFGTQMRDYDSRFQKLEDRLTKASNELRSELQKRLDGLESLIRSETESLRNRLRTEQSERSHALERLGRELVETARVLERNISQLDEQTAKDIRDLRQQMLDQSKALSTEIKERHEQLQAGLDSEATQIRGAMTARESLAEMLSEVSLRLKGEFRVPGAA